MESQNRHLKRRLEQHLILRGSRDFASLEEYDRFVQGVVRAANAKRQKRLAEELACMRPLPAGRLAEYREYEPVVSSQSLIRVKQAYLFGALALDWAHAAGGTARGRTEGVFGAGLPVLSAAVARGSGRAGGLSSRHRAAVAQARSLYPLPAPGGALSQRGVSGGL